MAKACPAQLPALITALGAGKFDIPAARMFDKYGLDAPDSATGWVIEESGDELTIAIFDAADPHFQVHWMNDDGAARAWHLAFDGTEQQTMDELGAAGYADYIIAPLGALTDIAKKHLRWETLELRNSDRLDFHDTSVSAVRAALIAAYELGFRDARKLEGK